MATPAVNETKPIPKLLQIGWIRRLTNHIPPGQFGRYLLIGIWNTLFGYGDFAAWTAVLTPIVPHGYIFAGIIAAPVNMTVSFLGYKWFVFKTRGHYLREWTRCLVVYGSQMVIGVSALPGVVFLVRKTTGISHGAPYIAGALIMGFGVIYSFLGHKNFSFRPRR